MLSVAPLPPALQFSLGRESSPTPTLLKVLWKHWSDVCGGGLGRRWGCDQVRAECLASTCPDTSVRPETRLCKLVYVAACGTDKVPREST